ncbi:MAG TPA: hypothetical protein VFI24_22230 [Pyrinomonadaceae bacterium]|nr:hypothetical protein [Pyrinomonadaceae bacterium]
MSKEHIHQLQMKKAASGAFVGLGVISVIQMLGVSSLDVTLRISLCSFAVSIPSLTALFICTMLEDFYEFSTTNAFLRTVTVIGYLSTLIGISGLFCHFAYYAGIIFITGTLVGFLAVSLYDNKLQALDTKTHDLETS